MNLREKKFTNIRKIFFRISICLFSALFVSISTQSIVYGDQVEHSNEINLDTTIINRKDLPSNIPINQAITNLNNEKYAKLDNNSLPKGFTVVSGYIIRMSGTTCQLYIAWSGTDSINIWRANNIRVTNLSWLNPYTYFNVNNFYQGTTAAATGTCYVGTMSIPTNETKAEVSASNLQAYYLAFGWRSALINNGTVVIN